MVSDKRLYVVGLSLQTLNILGLAAAVRCLAVDVLEKLVNRAYDRAKAVVRGSIYTSSRALCRGRPGNLLAGLDAYLPLAGVSDRAFWRLDFRTCQRIQEHGGIGEAAA